MPEARLTASYEKELRELVDRDRRIANSPSVRAWANRGESLLRELDLVRAELRAAKDELQDRADHATADNPGYDGTDAAHPAWWRGDAHGSRFTANALRGVAELGKVGTFGGEEVEAAALAIDAVRAERDGLLAALPRCTMRECSNVQMRASLGGGICDEHDTADHCSDLPWAGVVRRIGGTP